MIKWKIMYKPCWLWGTGKFFPKLLLHWPESCFVKKFKRNLIFSLESCCTLTLIQLYIILIISLNVTEMKNNKSNLKKKFTVFFIIQCCTYMPMLLALLLKQFTSLYVRKYWDACGISSCKELVHSEHQLSSI